MKIPARALRNTARAVDRNPPKLTERQALERDRIRDVGQTLLAHHGTHTLTIPSLAAALALPTQAVRRHFDDIDALLAFLLHRHLRTLANAIGQIPRTDPDCRARRIEAYIEHTRTPLGGFTEPHLLLVRDRLQLPPDELQSIEQTRQAIGESIAGDLAEEALGLLDLPCFNAARIEAILANLPPLALPEPAASVAPPPEPAPQPTLSTPQPAWLARPPAAKDDFLSRLAGHLRPQNDLPPPKPALPPIPAHASG